MSVGEAAIVPADKPAPGDKFSKSADGQTVFYPFGRSGIGYVVPDAEREQALRAALERMHRLKMRLLPLLPPAFVGAFLAVYMLFGGHPFLAVGTGLLGIVALSVGENALFSHQVWPLLDGLQTVGAGGLGLAERRRNTLVLAALLSVLTWFALQLFQWRISNLPAVPDEINYYSDISLPLLGAFVCAFCLVAMVAVQDTSVVRSGNGGRALAAFAILTLLEASCIGLVTWRIVNPTPLLRVAAKAVDCQGRRQLRHVAWSDVTDLGIVTGDYGKKYVRFDLGPASPLPTHPTPFWTPKHVFKQCQITGLSSDYWTVYQSVIAAWRNAHGSPLSRNGES